ncbi:RNA polymerase sigma factor (TIGR02999 family) [Alteromonadaceae bacterium 2753L.S.0a.02]|nr:RNA polymerase sigma factor (TIGR02999 family) [Alteromonadaceae bacterium 2753L.S.0a.02]
MSVITEYISAWNAGDEQSLDRLTVITYQRLHKSAKRALGDINGDHSLQATELVNELYCHFKKYKLKDCVSSSEYFAVAAWRLRDILKKRLRGKYAVKRDHGVRVSDYEVESIESPQNMLHTLVMSQSLDALRKVDDQAAQVTELRTFWEFSTQEICDILQFSESNYHRKWRRAKAFLGQHLYGDAMSHARDL